ncbi:MAG TPA: hypothetical protein ENK43_17880 [Planctomycetes bacterium]|nr:hypothetical protein [Planctomycetota bacterium]
MAEDSSKPPHLPVGASDAMANQAPKEGFLFFDGILEGPRGDAEKLHEAVERLNAVGMVEAQLDISGGRFTLLLDDQPRPIGREEEAREEAFLAALQELLDALPDRGVVESTLRCTAIDGGRVREVLFAVDGRKLNPLARTRDANAEDLRRIPRPLPDSADLRGLPLAKAFAVVALLLVAAGFSAWRSGWVDRLLAPAETELSRDAGDFEGLLSIDVDRVWGNYEVTLTRGPSYPADAEAVRTLEEARNDLAARAAVRAVADGGRIYVQLVDGDGEVLAEEPVGLAALLTDPEGKVETRLPGRMGVRSARLSLTSGLKDR